jgi:hypothetical protein
VTLLQEPDGSWRMFGGAGAGRIAAEVTSPLTVLSVLSRTTAGGVGS